LLDTLRGSEQSVARDLDSRKSSEDECHRKLIRVAVSLGLTAPQVRGFPNHRVPPP
jgi:hypothetical protein